jgi:hypothetical protein
MENFSKNLKWQPQAKTLQTPKQSLLIGFIINLMKVIDQNYLIIDRVDYKNL